MCSNVLQVNKILEYTKL